jgi:hypothetical protein
MRAHAIARAVTTAFGLVLVALAAGCQVKTDLKVNGKPVTGPGTNSNVIKPPPSSDALQVVFGLAGKPQFSDVRPGDTIKVKGKAQGSIPSRNPTIVLAQRYTGPEAGLTAAGLMKEFADNPEAMRKKYFGQEIICRGVVLEVRDHELFLAGR